MHALKKAMQWDEAVFGLELDLDRFMIVAVSDYNMGAMENKGLNIFNTRFVLARPDTATDMDYYLIDKVVAHEYFHNWTGNRVTCRDWFQLSLKEGLTVFRDQEYSADEYSRAVARIQDVRDLRDGQFPEDAGPMAHPVRPDSYVEINNFYTATVYDKGAEVVRMIHTMIGKAGFRRGMDLYFERHDGQAVTCDDFVRAMEERERRGPRAVPPLVFAGRNAGGRMPRRVRRGGAQLHAAVKQSCAPTPGQTEKLPFHIPFADGPARGRRRRHAAAPRGRATARRARTACSPCARPSSASCSSTFPSVPCLRSCAASRRRSCCASTGATRTSRISWPTTATRSAAGRPGRCSPRASSSAGVEALRDGKTPEIRAGVHRRDRPCARRRVTRSGIRRRVPHAAARKVSSPSRWKSPIPMPSTPCASA